MNWGILQDCYVGGHRADFVGNGRLRAAEAGRVLEAGDGTVRGAERSRKRGRHQGSACLQAESCLPIMPVLLEGLVGF